MKDSDTAEDRKVSIPQAVGTVATKSIMEQQTQLQVFQYRKR